MWSKIHKGEQGLALPMALILLLVGVSFVVPALALATTSLNYNRTVESNTRELYSADAGIEQVLWHVADNPGILPAEGGSSILEYLPSALIDVNGMSQVATTITNKGSRRYQITSIATNASDGHQTVVDCYIYIFNLSNLTTGAITSNGELKINNATVHGYVYYNESNPTINSSTIEPIDPIQIEQTNWPSAEELQAYYYPGDGYSFPSGTIYVQNYPAGLGPVYCQGNLTVDNAAAGNPTLTLNNTIYVARLPNGTGGNVTFNQSGNKNYTVNLNGQTIFAEGNIGFPSNVVTIDGSGCIIAMGDIDFQPSIESSTHEYVLVMSVAGTASMKPNGGFYGSLVGSVEVDLLPGSSINWIDPNGFEMNFPDDKPMIMTYEIR